MVASTDELEDHLASWTARVTFLTSQVEKSDILGITLAGWKSLNPIKSVDDNSCQ